jgi:hypothetical protein
MSKQSTSNKKRRYKQKKSELSDLPIKLNSWPPWAAELLPLVEVSFRPDALKIAERLASTYEPIFGERCEGTGSQFLKMLSLDTDRFKKLREAAPEYFDGLNKCIASALNLNYPDGSLADIDRDTVTATLVKVFRACGEGNTKASTRAKALHFWLARLRSPAKTEPVDLLQEHLRGALNGQPEMEASLRASWLMIPTTQEEKLTEFAARLFRFGLQTPCLPTQYTLPERPAWPVDALQPVLQELLDSCDNIVFGVFIPLTKARGDVTIALVQRLHHLSSRIADATSRNDGLTAEILMRCLADTCISLRWLLLKGDDALFEQFKERSMASERERLEKVRRSMEGVDSGVSEEASKALRQAYAELSWHLGKWPELLDVVFGPWSDVSTSAMLRELPGWENSPLHMCWESGGDAVHGSWRNLRKYSVDRCTNAFHLSHYIATMHDTKSAGIVPVIAAIGICIEGLQDVLTWLREFAPEAADDMRDRIGKQEQILREWIQEHWTGKGYRWHDAVEARGSSEDGIRNQT